MTKQLIVDKSVFRATSTSKLEEFVKNHFLILPEVLYYECVTTNINKEKLLDRFRSVIINGAYICPSCKDMIQKEAKGLSPHTFLVNLEEAYAVRETFKRNSRPYSSKNVEKIRSDEMDLAQMLSDLANGFFKELAYEEPALLNSIRKFDSSKASRYERFVRWAEAVDSLDIRKAAKKHFSEITICFEKYCLSDEWVSWQFLRLLHILAQELCFLRQTGALIKTNRTEHDIQDVGYVLLLSHADALLTRDDGCSCLARAAFPEKDIFESLDDVPDEYICHWS